MPLEMKSKAELAAMIAERLGVPASHVMIHKHSTTPSGVTVVGVTRPVASAQRLADSVAAELRTPYYLKD